MGPGYLSNHTAARLLPRMLLGASPSRTSDVHDPVLPQRHQLVSLVVHHIFLELAHQRALLHRVGFAQHTVV